MPSLSLATSRALRAALEQRARGWGEDDTLRRALHDVCADCRALDLTAEQVIVALRAVWVQVNPPSRVAPEEWHRSYVRLVDDCLDHYFGMPE
jgi:hypothetical protein